MNRTATAFITIGTCLFAFAAEAQPVRNGVDVVVVRDIEGAVMTLDGMPNEPVWAQAESLKFVWDAPPGGLPGSGQFIDGSFTPADPPDPNNGTMRFLRDGNMLWVSWEVYDQSIGGGTSLFRFDGQILSIVNRSAVPDTVHQEVRHGQWQPVSEWFYTWWNATDTTDATTTYDDGSLVGSGFTLPGDSARGAGDFGVGNSQGHAGENRSEEDKLIWDFKTAMMGGSIANDDTHGPDVGYYFEMFIDLGALGYDFSAEGGDKVPFSAALNDMDYAWPVDPDNNFLSRVAFQNRWGNDYPDGVAYMLGMDGVTVSSGPVPDVTEPEVEIYHAGDLGAPTMDGVLDDDVWTQSDTLFWLKYQSTKEESARNPGLVGPLTAWFKPDPVEPIVVDPTEGLFKMFFEGSILYIGLDTDDQAISGVPGENGRDGFHIALRHVDSTLAHGALFTQRYEFAVDSSGAIQYVGAAAEENTADPTALSAVVGLKGASTAADPTDQDEGYQMEVAIDLAKVAGYPSDLGDGKLWIALNFFDGDFLEAANDSYATRTWFAGERTPGAPLYVYMNPDISVGIDDELVDIPTGIRIEGNYPNPFSGSTMLAYTLPQAGDVKISVFNVLGQKVAELDGGTQGAGDNRVEFKSNGLSAGLYLYRVELIRASDGEVRHTAVGNMLIAK